MSESAKRSLVISVYAGLILSTLAVYWQVRNFDFVNYDDNDYVYENQHVPSGLTYDGLKSAFTSAPAGGNWLPLTWLSLMLDCQLFGLNPGRMHLVNVLLHLVNALLLFTVLRKMTGALWQSAFVAAAFALHPMHVESVAWITERKDVLSTCFLLLTLTAYVSYVRRRGVGRYLLTVLLFALGLLAKPMLVTLPFLLLLLDYWPLNRFDSQSAQASSRQILYRAMIEKIPFFVLSAASSVTTFLVQRASGSMPNFNILPLQSRVANSFLSYAKYVGKMFWPENLAVFYPFDAHTVGPWLVSFCALLIIAISALCIRFGRRRKYLIVGWLWFVAALLPVIGLIQSGGQSMADRYSYIPYIGLFIMAAWSLPELLSEWAYRRIALSVAAAMAVMAMGIGTYRQTSYWKNSSTLFTHAIEVTPNNAIAHNNLAWFIATDPRIKNRDTHKAVRLAGRACELSKYEAPAMLDTLGAAYAAAGRFSEAIDTANKALDLADAANQPQLRNNIQHHLSFYTQGKPYIESAFKPLPDPNKL